eukprot:6195447-Pleurochrysis_carterae.AAC.1
MSMQAQALQRGEKFKESEVRPKVEANIERAMVLDWLMEQSEVTLVEPGAHAHRVQIARVAHARNAASACVHGACGS